MLIAACIIGVGMLLATAAEAIPAFPGAEGYGKCAKGGRGGEAIFVTNLDDSGPGSLRAALDASGPRTVIFRVSGTITLETPIEIKNPCITIAGQTAPGAGIAITTRRWRGSVAAISIATNDVILRYLRIRPAPPKELEGVLPPTRHGAAHEYTWIAPINIGGVEAHDVIIDHVSASWGSKHQIGAWRDASNITIQRCIMSEGIKPEPMHKGSLVGGGADRVTFYRCLFAHNAGRNPYIKAPDDRDKPATFQVVNNVIYNWRHHAVEDGCDDWPYWAPDPGDTYADLVGNYFKPGPDTNIRVYEILLGKTGKVRSYVRGNIGPHRPSDTLNEWDVCGLQYVSPEQFAPPGTPAPELPYRATSPFDTPTVPTISALAAYEDVLKDAGATLPKRDVVDQRVVADVTNGTGRIIDHPAEVGGWPEMPVVSRPDDYDTDNDGMPDAWETARFGSLGRDGRGDANNDGYTDIEDFLNEGLAGAN